jgi:hypothetical protein
MQITLTIIFFGTAAFRALAHIGSELFCATDCTAIHVAGTSVPCSTLTLSPTLKTGSFA